MRSRAYASAFRYAVDATARPCTPTAMRAPFIIRNICFMPMFWLAADEDAAAPVVLAEVEHGGRRGPMPSLCSIDAVTTSFGAPSEPSSFDPDLRHDEQRHALGAGGRAFDAREHQVDDVLGQVVVAGRDPALGAADLVAVARRGARRALGAHRRRTRRAARTDTWCRRSGPPSSPAGSAPCPRRARSSRPRRPRRASAPDTS